MNDAPCAGVAAWLVNVYPSPSHGFIRREIAALEAVGWRLHPISLRRSKAPLVEAADRAEALRTEVLIDTPLAGALRLCAGVMRQCLSRPRRLWVACRLALRLSRRSDGRVVAHLGHLALACVLLPRLSRVRATHLHVHFGSNAADVALLCRCLGGPPYSLTVHGPEEWAAPQRSLTDKIAAAAFVVGISAFTLARLRTAAAPADRHKLQLVRCGLPPALLQAPPSPPPDVARFVCVGRLCGRKAQALLVQAAARLASDGTRIDLVLVGDGEARGAIAQEVRRHGLGSSVRLTGWLDEGGVLREMMAARALVMPSLDEGLPVVLTEAMALGRPVIATRIAGVPELVRDGIDGWLVPPADVPALACALARCLAAPPERLRAMGACGRERVTAAHDAHKQAIRLAGLITAGKASDNQSDDQKSDTPH